MNELIDSFIEIYRATPEGNRRMSKKRQMESFMRFILMLTDNNKYKQYRTPILVWVQNYQNQIYSKLSEEVLDLHNRSQNNKGIARSEAFGTRRRRSRRLV